MDDDDLPRLLLGFTKAEGILPAPEPSHAIWGAMQEALACKESGEEKVILTALCGHGHLDLTAYEQYLADWDAIGAPWDLWVERAESARDRVARLLNAGPDEVAANHETRLAVRKR